MTNQQKAKRGVGKKKVGNNSKTPIPDTCATEADGSRKVPTYKGVWVDKNGKYFVKFEGKRVYDTDNGVVRICHSKDEAAKRYDEIASASNSKALLNFNADGSRILGEEEPPFAAASGIGGSSVVPALSVINIKVRQRV